MIEKAENKAMSRKETKVKAPETRGEEFYFSADGDFPPVTIVAKDREEAEQKYQALHESK